MKGDITLKRMQKFNTNSTAPMVKGIQSPQRISRFVIMIVALITLAACQRSLNRIIVNVDNETRTIETNVKTVRELLAETNISLGNLDRVNPDLNYSLEPDMTVKVIRVTEMIDTITRTLAFERRVIVNEALGPGEQRLSQLGVSGQEEIVTKIVYEDGLETERITLAETVTQAPIEEILIVGVEKSETSVPINGLVTYLSGGNAWLMKDNSDTRRPITMGGDLDGRVFDLSADGTALLYSRTISEAVDAPLNELWTLDTRIVGEHPNPLPITGVLYAEWSPSMTETIIAYSTADRVASQPGWRAKNDLWLWDPNTPISDAVEVLPSNTSGLYSWWGSNFTWSPNGKMIAFANANQVGVINVVSQTVTSLITFTPYETNSTWVWVPTVAWSPDSRFIAATVHGPPTQGESPEASPIFDLWLFSVDGTLKVKVWEQVGMWSNPAWHEDGIIFGRALNPLNTVTSLYELNQIDWDGSNPQVLYPLGEEAGVTLPEIAKSPQTDQPTFLFVNRNNLFLYDSSGRSPQKLTSDGQSSHPRWAMPLATSTRLTTTTSLTISTPLTASTQLTESINFTATENITKSSAITNTLLITDNLTQTQTVTLSEEVTVTNRITP